MLNIVLEKLKGQSKKKSINVRSVLMLNVKNCGFHFHFMDTVFLHQKHTWINISHLLLQDKENGYLYAS